MIKNLTSLKWRKNIYYVSNDVIFDIESRKKKFDIDCCDTYLVDIDLDKADGTMVDLNPEAYINNVPYIVVKFVSDSEDVIERYFPLQYLIEEGDKFVDGKVIQSHPDVYDGKYVNKFNQEVFDYIKGLIKGKETFDLKNVKLVTDALPDWLIPRDNEYMTEEYIDKSFLKGTNYNQNLATKGGDVLFKVDSVKLGIGDDIVPINIWSEEIILEVLKAIYAEKFINKYGNSFKYLTTSSMERIANNIREVNTSNVPKNVSTFLNVIYNNGECEKVNFESLCASSDIDTYYEYKKANDTSKYYSLIKDSDSYNSNTTLEQYYSWSDRVNAPYKEDLWNTVENRAANINDAKKDDQGEYILDENGNYIYENCERCWEGAVNAPGAKYPWMTVSYSGERISTITFKYTYPDGSIKEVKPWGDRLFGGSERTWGVASIPSEFEDNEFLIPENRSDGGQSTFDINRFEMILNYVD